MDQEETTGRTPALAQLLGAWRESGDPPNWASLKVRLGGLSESVCLIRWTEGERAVIEEAGAQAVLAYGKPLAGASVDALTPGRSVAALEATKALESGRPFTVEDVVGAGEQARRIARFYLPLDETPPAIACGVVRID